MLQFEKPMLELEAKIDALRQVGSDGEIDIAAEIKHLEKKLQAVMKKTYSSLTPWQITQLSRHPERPHINHYVDHVFTDFQPLWGDRRLSKGESLLTGTARLNGEPVMVMGHRKGCNVKENVAYNFGMCSPEDYRKALRLFEMAERFRLPIFTFIDTPGAYPGIGAEERNQSEAIAKNLLVMSKLKTPIVCTVVGEGGSGGALAIGVGDRLLMLENSIYSVISPEGCASILWKDAGKAEDAASTLGITANRLLELGLVDEVIAEPMGGAHRHHEQVMNNVSEALTKHLAELRQYDMATLVLNRQEKLKAVGK